MGRAEMSQWNYLRVKRGKQTIFLVCEMTDTVDAAKAKLSQIIGGDPPADNLKLMIQGEGGAYEVLEEGKTLADGKCEPSKVIYMVYKKPDTEDEWEEVNIPPIEEAGSP